MINLNNFHVELNAAKVYALTEEQIVTILDDNDYEIDRFDFVDSEKDIWLSYHGCINKPNYQIEIIPPVPRLILKKKEYIPQRNQIFYYFDLYAAKVIESTCRSNDFKNEYCVLYQSNNYFKTREQAQNALDKIQKIINQIKNEK